MCKIVVFDLDGMLVDISGDFLVVVNYCFCDMGLGDVFFVDCDVGVVLWGGKWMLIVGFECMDCYSFEMVEVYYLVLFKVYGEIICEYSWIYFCVMEIIEMFKF